MTSRIKRGMKTLADDSRGSVFVEATLVLPLLVIILAAIAEWGLTLYQYHILSSANGAAVRQLIINRGFPNPYNNVLDEFGTWAENLNVTSSQVTVEVQNSSNVFTPCTTDAGCTTLLDAAEGKSARVTVEYACEMQFTPQIASLCPIQVRTIGLIE
jgi:Flp pilus assembly protein TadG